MWRSTWEKGKGLYKKSRYLYICWVSPYLAYYAYIGPSGFNIEMDHSFLATIGGIFAPTLAPLGFGSWQAGASLITGFFAKESIISTMNIIYFVPDQASLQGLMA